MTTSRHAFSLAVSTRKHASIPTVSASPLCHRSGDVCLFRPLTGRFIARFPAQADRLDVADILGDWREEIIILQGTEPASS